MRDVSCFTFRRGQHLVQKVDTSNPNPSTLHLKPKPLLSNPSTCAGAVSHGHRLGCHPRGGQGPPHPGPFQRYSIRRFNQIYHAPSNIRSRAGLRAGKTERIWHIKTIVQARFWLCVSGENPSNCQHCSLFARNFSRAQSWMQPEP